MKDSWCLATNRSDLSAAEIVRLYGKRFTIEETFRDTKGVHFGMGLKATHIGDSARRDRLLLLGAMAHALLTLLGAAGERAGMDRMLKVNTSKQRQHSLYNQGLFWYDALPNMPDDRLATLMSAYEETIREQEFFREIFHAYPVNTDHPNPLGCSDPRPVYGAVPNTCATRFPCRAPTASPIGMAIAYVRLETASLRGDVTRTAGTASALGRILSDIGTAVDGIGVDCFGDATADNLRAHSTRLRGAVLHGLTVLAELQACAGRLEQVAAVLEAEQHD